MEPVHNKGDTMNDYDLTEEQQQDANEAQADQTHQEIKESLAGLNGPEEQARAEERRFGIGFLKEARK